MGIDHGGAPALGSPPLLRLGARAQCRQPLPPVPLPPQRRHPQTRPGAAGDSELGLDVSWGDEFSLRLLGHLAGILPNPCPKVLHGLAIVGLTLQIRSGLEHSRLKNHTCSRLLYVDVVLSELST